MCFSKFPDDPTVEWPVEDLGEKILSVTERIKPDSVCISACPSNLKF